MLSRLLGVALRCAIGLQGAKMTETIYSQILSGEIPATFLHQDDRCVAFWDINPKAPIHFLVIPRKPISMLSEATDEDTELLGYLVRIATKLAKEQGCGDAFRLVVNNGQDAGQTVFHLHLHVMGGFEMSEQSIGSTGNKDSG